ncbi:MAG: hypothetical protein GDA48_29275, partial [Hormoscilla sp. GM102CHS1]|nr:hypothetical protein [Hormoscilla sp. GM102CHS1]
MVKIKAYSQALAALLYEEALATVPEELETLEGLEATARQQLLEYVSPEIAPFFIQSISGTTAGRSRTLNSILGKLKITSKQATYFDVKPYRQWSPYLEKCCLLLSANSSYEHASQDLEVLTGMSRSRGTQQRLVPRHSFELPTVQEVVEEISIDQDKGRTHEFELTHLPESLEEMSIDQDKERTHELELPTIQEVVEEISINPDKERTHSFELTHLPESLANLGRTPKARYTSDIAL